MIEPIHQRLGIQGHAADNLRLLACPAQARTQEVAAGPNAQERLQTDLIDARPGDVVAIGPGQFAFTDGLSLDVSQVTVTGAGQDKTFLSFAARRAPAKAC